MVMEFLCASSSTAAAVTSPGRETGLTLKGAVGLALRACGMRVRIGRLARDESVCDVYAEIEATNPARHDRGRVFVGDDGVIRWECKLSDSDRDVQGLQPTEIAAALASGLPGQRRP
jgi:hypothetical protein